MGLVELDRFPNAMLAEIVRGRLAAEGVDAVTFDAGMNIADSAALAIPVRVMVPQDQLKRAQYLLSLDWDVGEVTE
jgi:hypothetical protein